MRHVQTLDGVTLDQVPVSIDFFFEPARRRTVLARVKGEDKFYHTVAQQRDFPDTVFGVGRARGAVAWLSVWGARWRGVELTVSGGFNAVCLGRAAAARIQLGTLDPIDAYWLTTFRSDRVPQYSAFFTPYTLPGVWDYILKLRSRDLRLTY